MCSAMVELSATYKKEIKVPIEFWSWNHKLFNSFKRNPHIKTLNLLLTNLYAKSRGYKPDNFYTKSHIKWKEKHNNWYAFRQEKDRITNHQIQGTHFQTCKQHVQLNYELEVFLLSFGPWRPVLPAYFSEKNLLTGASKKQSTLSRPSAKAEYKAFALTTSKLLWAHTTASHIPQIWSWKGTNKCVDIKTQFPICFNSKYVLENFKQNAESSVKPSCVQLSIIEGQNTQG